MVSKRGLYGGIAERTGRSVCCWGSALKFEVVFVHLLNDYSGSPRVLKNIIHALTSEKIHCLLYVGHPAIGILSDCTIPVRHYWYRRLGNRWGTLFTFFISQLILFVKLLFDRSISKDAVVYVNTLLPFGSALYGKLTGRRVIYHLHEISLAPNLLKRFLLWIAQHTSSLNIYVSQAHRHALPLPGITSAVVYNALDETFIAEAASAIYCRLHDGCFNVLMIASLRDYKGIPELLALAEATQEQPTIHYHLLVNDDEKKITAYMYGRTLSSNLTLYPATPDVTAFYRRASVVLNLSRIDQWVETFGLTILEAMAFGIPVIVPPVGGPAELVEEGRQGYLIDSRNQTALRQWVLKLAGDELLCQQMSESCRKRAADFSQANFEDSLNKVIRLVCGEKV